LKERSAVLPLSPLPRLSLPHLCLSGFIAPFYSIEWFTTLFTLASPFDLTVALWDMFFAGVQVTDLVSSASLPLPPSPFLLPQDAQLRCSLAMMEVLEPLLLKMTTEELLKEFRYLCQTVTRDDVILRALRIQLGPVRVGQETNNSRIVDPKYKEERSVSCTLCLLSVSVSSSLVCLLPGSQTPSSGSELNI
jgi:hypothetical protein